MRSAARSAWPLAALWAVVVATALLARPLMPIDETRYAAVAWDMWNSGNYLVPHLNGEIYSHKPPLLFWLINAAWMVFGVHEWVIRLMGPAFALGDLLLVGAVACTLWPDDDRARGWAGAALLACPVFALYSSLLMFDAMLTFFILVALLGVLLLSRNGAHGALVLLVLGVGGGILSKGPVALVYILPVAIAAPWWSPALRSVWKRFAARIALGILAGAAIALAWAVPAAIFGGPEYREAILWTQTAGRVAQAFDHDRPFWYYFVLLPAALFPLAYMVPLRQIFVASAWRDSGLRMCAVWCLGGLVALSLISGKQAHYLLPLLPAVALMAARMISVHESSPMGGPAFVAGVYALGAAVAIGAAFALPAESFPQLDASIGGLAAMTVAGVTGAAIFFVRPAMRQPLWWAAACSAIFLAAFQLMIGPSLRERYDTVPFAKEVATRLDGGLPIMHHGEYHGQFHFAGRLRQPLPVLKKKNALAAWCAEHPEGYVIWYWKPGEEPFPGRMESVHPFRGKMVGLVRAEIVTARE